VNQRYFIATIWVCSYIYWFAKNKVKSNQIRDRAQPFAFCLSCSAFIGRQSLQKHKINNLINLIASSEFCRQLSSCPPTFCFVFFVFFLYFFLSDCSSLSHCHLLNFRRRRRFSLLAVYVSPWAEIKKTHSDVNFFHMSDGHSLSHIHDSFNISICWRRSCLFANISSSLTLMTLTLRVSFSSFASRFVFC